MDATLTHQRPHSLPKSRPPIQPNGNALMQSEPPFDWAGLVSRIVHPVKVAIIEAVLWVGQPLSATELTAVFDDENSLGVVAHHAKSLADLGVLEVTATRQVRGARESYYFLRGDG